MKVTDAIAELRATGGIIARASAPWLRVWVDPSFYGEPKLFQRIKDPARGFDMTGRWKPLVADMVADDWRIVERFEAQATTEAA